MSNKQKNEKPKKANPGELGKRLAEKSKPPNKQNPYFNENGEHKKHGKD